ncbi:hypothetical protein VAEU17_4280212 [Vibrio aestuarianus]|nr:hypothetical protein VAEU17_4280212 [Vibrio aestuarianus]
MIFAKFSIEKGDALYVKYDIRTYTYTCNYYTHW